MSFSLFLLSVGMPLSLFIGGAYKLGKRFKSGIVASSITAYYVAITTLYCLWLVKALQVSFAKQLPEGYEDALYMAGPVLYIAFAMMLYAPEAMFGVSRFFSKLTPFRKRKD